MGRWTRILAAALLLAASAPVLADGARTGAAACGTPGMDLHQVRHHQRAGERVVINASITAVFRGQDQLGGFFVQQHRDGEPRGIFVYAPQNQRGNSPEPPSLQIGERIAFEAEVHDFRGRRQLRRPTRISRCGRDPIQPTDISLAAGAAHGPDQQPLDTLVRLTESTVVDVYDLDRYGSLLLAAERRFVADASSANTPTIVLDDASYRAHPRAIPYLDPTTGTRRVGDRAGPIVGILTEAFDTRRIHPLDPGDHRPFTTPQRPASPPSRQEGHLRIVTFNLENYFLTLGQRGAADATEQAIQRRKLIAALLALDADIIGLVELENRSGVIDDLVTRLNARLPAERHYAADPHPAPGSDAIAVGLLHRPAVVTPAGPPQALRNRAHQRTPIRGEYEPLAAPGQRFGVTVVHLRSRSRCPQQGDTDRGQGCWNQQRSEQMAAILRALPGGSAAEFLIGDLNAHPGEAPLQAARSQQWSSARTDPSERHFTYNFRGRAAPLDDILATESARAGVVAGSSWAINADEPPFGRYNGRAPFPGVWRSSDHDPVWVDLRIAP